MMRNFKKTKAVATLILCTVLACTACGYYKPKETAKVRSLTPDGSPATSYYEKAKITDANGKFWIPLSPAIASIGYQMKDEKKPDGYTSIGYTDVMYKLRPGSTEVLSLGEKVSLSDAPQLRNGQLYITPKALSKLLQTKVAWNPYTGEINIATPTVKDTAVEQGQNQLAKPLKIQSLSPSQSNELVAYAKSFLGVPYDFGAAPYEESKKFDCSSFTQYVFKKFGVNLPRLAKDQDNLGSRVNRNELKSGDLVFFTVPGRFENNAIPGHVGIYIGDGKFIHTWGDPGVQISELDTGYWSHVILHMQRVL
ncbi:cell wall hydrolase [Bacillus sp. FJAT-27264]|uniref:C40 family peptidase n=1 Tax=Paenibacillus sp. (strain DSM 101736 / FJAT-27264) TaxID=1850362 RepID=UPI000807C959|nr:C40 family peptidase [Bacillus sp. FJAT-27264]OBZ14515.1 cell wall hydrolase [Bacillus sp. FJAT-27264]